MTEEFDGSGPVDDILYLLGEAISPTVEVFLTNYAAIWIVCEAFRVDGEGYLFISEAICIESGASVAR